MEELSKYTVGIDVGTENVRAVMLEVRGEKISVIGYGESRNNGGMRKGVVTNLMGPAEATDRTLKQVEKMSGHYVDNAYVSINGSHIVSVKTDGMITVSNGTPITLNDIDRLKEAAISGRMPANREILNTIPLNYTLDGQSGIQDPVGMTGVRLEMKANVISGLCPSVNALNQVMDSIKVQVLSFIPTAAAAARAVLSEKQMENGVAVIDLGASTTSIAVYDEGDLQYVGVVPAGSNNITKDLAISLQIDMDAAEDIKLRFVTADFPESDREIIVKHENETIKFTRNDVNEVVKARLEDIFEHVLKLLKNAGYAQKLPEGILIVGGGVKMRGIDQFAKEILGCAVKIGKPGADLSGVVESVEKSEYATAVGLALLAIDDNNYDKPLEPEKEPFSIFKIFKKKQ